MSFHPVKRVDMTGYRSGDLEALSYHSQDRAGRALWNTRCHACGGESIIASYALRGVTPSKYPKTHCGCKSQRALAARKRQEKASAPPPPPPPPKPAPVKPVRKERQFIDPFYPPYEHKPEVLGSSAMVLAMRVSRTPIRDIVDVTGLSREEVIAIINQHEGK